MTARGCAARNDGEGVGRAICNDGEGAARVARSLVMMGGGCIVKFANFHSLETWVWFVCATTFKI